MAADWTQGKISMVLHPVGKDSNGNQRYRRGNYDFMQLDGDGDGNQDWYVLAPTADRLLADTALVNGNKDDGAIGSMFGYYNGEVKIVEAHQPGEDNTWGSLHFIGYV